MAEMDELTKEIADWMEDIIDTDLRGFDKSYVETAVIMFSPSVIRKLMRYGAKFALIEAFVTGSMWQKHLNEKAKLEQLLSDTKTERNDNG